MCPVAVWKAFSGSKVSSNSQGDSSFGIACLAVLKRKPWLQTRQCILWPSFVFFFILMAKENACLGKAFPSSVSWGYWRPFERESEAFSPQEVMVAFWPSGYWLATITRKKMKGSLTNKWKKETTVRPYKTARSVPVFHYVRTCFSSSFIYCWWGTSFHSLWKRRWNQTFSLVLKTRMKENVLWFQSYFPQWKATSVHFSALRARGSSSIPTKEKKENSKRKLMMIGLRS